MGIKHLKADSKIEHILEALDQDAGLIIDNIVSSDDLENIKDKIVSTVLPYISRITSKEIMNLLGFKQKE